MPRLACVVTTLMSVVASVAAGQACLESPTLPPLLGSPSGCDYCTHYLLKGALEPHPQTRYYILSDLPERLLSTGVLYATGPVLPADRSGYPNLDMRTQITANDFTTIDDDFDILFWHTSNPTDGSQPRRIIVYARNQGTGAVQVSPQQIAVSDGGFLGMCSTLGERVLQNAWDAPIAPLTIAPAAGKVLAYSKQFAASSNTADTSTNPDCFGRVRAAVVNPDPDNHPTDLQVYIVAIDGAPIFENKIRAEMLLLTGATSGDPFDLNTPPSGCANRRATGVFETFTWRNDPITLDVSDPAVDGMRFRMTLGEVNTQSCPDSRQTAPLLLRPGYVRPDTVGNYMVDYRITVRLINTSLKIPRNMDVQFTQGGASIGLAWQVLVGEEAAADGVVDAQPVRSGWAGPAQAVLERSFLEFDGGPLTLAPCEVRHVAVHFLVLGASTLPFDIAIVNVPLAEVIVDNHDAEFSTVGAWPTSANAGYWSVDSQYHFGDGGESQATWSPNLPSDGWYSVYAWWVVAANRAPLAPYTIAHIGGADTRQVDQSDAGTAQRWNHLGDFRFPAATNATVSLASAVPSQQVVSADAVRFAYIGPPPADLPGDIDQDGDVDFEDLLALVACLNSTDPCGGASLVRSDIDDDGDVDMADCFLFQRAYEP